MQNRTDYSDSSNETLNQNDLSNSREFLDNYNFDKLLDNVDKIEDLEVLGNIFNKLESDLLNKRKMLKNIQKENSKSNNEMDSKKHFISELDNLIGEEQQKTDFLQDMIEMQHKNLGSLSTQQVDNLVQFEQYVKKISGKFTSAPQDYEVSSLRDVVCGMQHELDMSMKEHSANLNTLDTTELMSSRPTENKAAQLNLALKILEDDISQLNISTVKLMSSEKQLKNKVKYNSI